MTERGVLLDDRIQVLSDGPDLRDRGIRAGSVRSRAGHADSRRGLAACYALPAGDRSSLRCAAGYTRQRTTGLGALQLPLGDERIVAADFDIDIIFERQRDGVLRGQVQHSGPHQFAEALRVREPDGRNGDWQIRPNDDGRLWTQGCDRRCDILRPRHLLRTHHL